MWDLGLDDYIIRNKILISVVILEKVFLYFLCFVYVLGVFCCLIFSIIFRYIL